MNKTITASELEDPLAFDMEKILVFKMPKCTSKVMYDKIDKDNPVTDFKETEYYKQKRHLGGFMSPEGMKGLKKQIDEFGSHNHKSLYKLSGNVETQRRQIQQMILAMDDSVEACRLE